MGKELYRLSIKKLIWSLYTSLEGIYIFGRPFCFLALRREGGVGGRNVPPLLRCQNTSTAGDGSIISVARDGGRCSSCFPSLGVAFILPSKKKSMV